METLHHGKSLAPLVYTSAGLLCFTDALAASCICSLCSLPCWQLLFKAPFSQAAEVVSEYFFYTLWNHSLIAHIVWKGVHTA